MKIRLTPELSYVIGFWRSAKAGPGIGVKGPPERLSIFAKAIIEFGLAEQKKILSGKSRIYFYHSKLKRFFQDIEDNLSDRIKYNNDYSKAYFAGMFDSVGEIDKQGRISFPYEEKNMLLLNKFGFTPKIIKHDSKKIYIGNPKKFLEFISPFRRFKD